MLKQRVITAVVLLAMLLPALFAANAWPFMLLTMGLFGAGGWEWGRLNGCSAAISCLGGVCCVTTCLHLVQAGWVAQTSAQFWLLAGSIWVLLGSWMLQRGVAGWILWPRVLRWLGGLGLLVLAWLALAQAHQRGVNFLLSVLVLVWAADIFAYFFGRSLGGHWFRLKLAPSISPGKTWEGAIGGAFGVLLVSVAWVEFDRHQAITSLSFFGLIWSQGWYVAVPAAMFMTIMSVVGDLVESLVKRSAGVKDSSGLLPGHGGVLDRVDALLPTLPLAMMLVAWI
ncbi:MAG: phosphatidate cytidylyltransferase [Burkholderiales bacterium]